MRRRLMQERRHGAAGAEGGNAAVDTEQVLREQIAAAGGAKGLAAFLLPDGSDLTQIPQDPLNPLTPEKIELGSLLFHETGIALNPVVAMDAGTYSCPVVTRPMQALARVWCRDWAKAAWALAPVARRES
ncbi:MAG: hypothetical protein ACK4GC_04135 [Paracoccaceae bacterium]